MNAYYGLPSGTYTITISKSDLIKLASTGRISIFISGVPCKTGRTVYNKEKQVMETLDKKEVSNRLMFYLKDNVADIQGGISKVQFLNIRIEEE